MSDRWTIKSRSGDYHLHFTDDFTKEIRGKTAASFWLADRIVLELFKNRFGKLIDPERLMVIDATEQNKTIAFCESAIRALIGKNIKKNDRLIAMGGGVLQDITAFIATILFRGMEWYFIPSTLLAQADSCVGSKSSINVGEYKNQVGTFYPPSEIFLDRSFLKTLSVGELKSGIGEIFHFLLIAGDMARAEALSCNYDRILRDPDLLDDFIRASLEIKKKTVEIDELDKKERNLFNYGHTFGHAIEGISNFGIPHGQAVTMGMDIANYISRELGYMDAATFEAVHRLLSANVPRFDLAEDQMQVFLKYLSKDKKNIGDKLGCILSQGPGCMQKMQIPLDDALQRMISGYFRDIHPPQA